MRHGGRSDQTKKTLQHRVDRDASARAMQSADFISSVLFIFRLSDFAVHSRGTAMLPKPFTRPRRQAEHLLSGTA
jgi:hypothetical protein